MTNDATITVTAKESNVLHAIEASNYNDGRGRGIWVFSIECEVTGEALGGVIASLAKKGLLTLGADGRPNGVAGEDAYVDLTDAGLAFLNGTAGFRTVAARTPKAKPTPAVTTTAEPKETVGAASVWARPQSEKLVALNLAMCPKGKLFGAKASCKCCGAIVQPVLAEAVPATKKSRKPRAKADVAPAISDATRAKNADAKAARAAKRAGTALASVGSAS